MSTPTSTWYQATASRAEAGTAAWSTAWLLWRFFGGTPLSSVAVLEVGDLLPRLAARGWAGGGVLCL